MRRRRLAAIAFAGVFSCVPLACSKDDGRALPPADPRRTTTTSTAPAIQPPTGEIDVFTLRSTAFADGGVIPEALTCRGADVSPDLSWTGTPLDALSLALVVRDRDAGGFVHWVVTDIDPFVQGIGEGGVPENAVEGRNGSGTVGWLGPCPPSASGTHTYEIVLLALTSLLEVPPDASGEEAASLIEATAAERAVLTGTVTAGP